MKYYLIIELLMIVVLNLAFPVLVSATNSRLALIIGNAKYEDNPLKNPENDATDLAAILQRLGFDVVIKTNINKKVMKTAIQEFGQQLHNYEVGLFYFSGHGVQTQGINYLIPLQAEIETEADIEYETIPADYIIDQMGQASTKMNIIILDACRNNPFKRSFTRSLQKGLAIMDAPKGTIIAFATAPNTVAFDGEGRNGIFTKHLLTVLQEKSHMSLGDFFIEVTAGVDQETNGQQVPWQHVSMTQRFCFADCDSPSFPISPTPTPSLTGTSQQIPITPSTQPVQTVDKVTFENFKEKSPTLKQIVQRGELRVGCEAGYLPFEMLDKNGNIIGFDIDLAQELAQDMGVKLVPVNTTWNDIIPTLLSRKKFDIIISGMGITEERKAQVNFSDAYINEGVAILVNKKYQDTIRSYKDLNASKYIATSKTGTAAEVAIKKNIPNAIYKSFETATDAALEVINGKADAFAYDFPFCVVFMAQQGTDKLFLLDDFLTEQPIGFAIPKDDNYFLQWLNHFLSNIKQDGRYERLDKKWFHDTNWLKQLQ